MDVTNRRELARRALDGYVSGPAASTRATARALAKVDNAVAVVLVEGKVKPSTIGTKGSPLRSPLMPGPPTGNAHDLPQHLIRLVVIAALGNSHRSRVET